MTPKEERDRWIRVGWEPDFMVWGPDVHEQGRFWLVVDAECEEIAQCTSEEDARVVAAALEAYDQKMWRAEADESSDG